MRRKTSTSKAWRPGRKPADHRALYVRIPVELDEALERELAVRRESNTFTTKADVVRAALERGLAKGVE